MKDLTVSNIDRQNILNNYVVLTQLQDYIGLPGMYFNEQYYFTKQQLADFYQINIVTMKNHPMLHTGEEKIADLGHAIEEL